jgi:short-subunit dehydrogenase
MLDLTNKIVLITGASSGIGWHLAAELAARGAQLVLLARRRQRLEALRQMIAEQGGRDSTIVVANVADPVAVQEAHDQVLERFPHGVDILINNAGRGLYSPFAEADREELTAIVKTNLLGVIECTRIFLPAMLKRGDGLVVFVSSVLGELPAPNNAVYGATKFAVSGLAESLEYELAPKGIGVLLVEPGLVATEFAEVSGTPAGRYRRLPRTSPDLVARRIVDAIERRRRRIIPDRFAHLGILWRRYLPRSWRIFYRSALRRA